MKGVLFNVVEEVVESTFGADVWDDVIERAGVDGAYTSLGNYPDDELVSIVGAAAQIAGVSRSDVLVLAGTEGFAHLAGRHESLLAGYSDWRQVVASLDGIIHPEVRKIYPDASVPTFTVGPDSVAGATPPVEENDVVVIEYRSERHLCRLAEGLLVGLGRWYDTPLTVRHRSCVLDGDDRCLLEAIEA